MKSFDIYSRYGTKYTADLIDENTIHFFPTGASYMRGEEKGSGEMNFIDPEGGPFIALWELASDVLHEDLPSREIVEIKLEKSYYIIKLQPSKKDTKPTKRKTKIKEQKILTHKKHIRN